MCTGLLPFRGDTQGVIFEAILKRLPVLLVVRDGLADHEDHRVRRGM